MFPFATASLFHALDGYYCLGGCLEGALSLVLDCRFFLFGVQPLWRSLSLDDRSVTLASTADHLGHRKSILGLRPDSPMFN